MVLHLVCVALLGSGGVSDWSLGVGTGLTAPLSAGQTKYFGPGVEVGARAGVRLAPAFEVGARASFLWLSSTSAPGSTAGQAFSVAPLARLSWPNGAAPVQPWVEFAAGLAMSGGAHGALSPAVGATAHLDALPGVAFGAEVRLTHVFRGAPQPTFDSRDATLLFAGLTAAWRFESQEAPVPSAADGDGDGLADALDACPSEAEDVDGVRDADGCPDLDDDGDGLADADDDCPKVAGLSALHGCPDGDGDGIADAADQCPRVKGLAPDGCPTYHAVIVSEQRIELRQKIFLAFGLTAILPRSFGLLDEVSRALSDHEHLCVRVEGHTDSAGNAEANLVLSQGRAAAVKDYLANHGIGSARLEAQGFGSQLPRDNNATADGRDNNRRVEFTIIPCRTALAPRSLR